METIRSENGTVIHRSRNLRGLRAYAGTHQADIVSIWATNGPSVAPSGTRPFIGHDGLLAVRFVGGSFSSVSWASFTVLCESLLTWRNLYGARLRINDRDAGTISSKNAELLRHSR